MTALNEEQKSEIRKALALCQQATNDLCDSCDSGMMSDSKSSVFAVIDAVEQLPLPPELGSELRKLAKEALHAIVMGEDVFSRASGGLGGIGKLRGALERALTDLTAPLDGDTGE